MEESEKEGDDALLDLDSMTVLLLPTREDPFQDLDVDVEAAEGEGEEEDVSFGPEEWLGD